MRITKNNNGSITTEAAVVLPVFICAVVSVIFLIKVIYTYEIIQNAIGQTAEEMSEISYVYHITGLQEVQDSLRDGLQDGAEQFEEHLSSIFDSYGDLNAVLNAADEISKDPLDELKSLVCFISAGTFEDLKTEICLPVVRLYMKNYLEDGKDKDTDKRLKRLNIVGGFNGLDFSCSSFFEDKNNDIDIVVRYKLRIPVPIRILPDLSITQRAVVKAWLEGDESNKASGDKGDVWSLDNFQRGIEIRSVFGANLPQSFPVLSSFEGGTAEVIKSMDLTAESYQDELAVTDKIYEYVDTLAKYNGQEEPWGKDGIVVKSADIKRKQLILVIPGNPVADEVEKALDGCVDYAASKGVVLKIEKYGFKKTVQGTENTDYLSESDDNG